MQKKQEMEIIDLYDYGSFKEIQEELDTTYKNVKPTRIYLSHNRLRIQDVQKILKPRLQLNNLRMLLLNNNLLNNIEIFQHKQIQFSNLEYLNLDNNNLTKIPVLKTPKLRTLTAQNNKISQIINMGKSTFLQLKQINFFNNQITCLQAFKNLDLTQLTSLILGKNKITCIQILLQHKLPQLSQLDLCKKIEIFKQAMKQQIRMFFYKQIFQNNQVFFRQKKTNLEYIVVNKEVFNFSDFGMYILSSKMILNFYIIFSFFNQLHFLDFRKYMWSYISSNKIIGTELKVQMHKNHLRNLSNAKSTIKGLTPWKPKHSISKLNNKYTQMKKKSIDKQNKSLITRMLDIQSTPPLNTTNIIPEHFPSNTKTHALLKEYERYKLKFTINKQNYNILKKIESVGSLYSKDKLKEDWKANKNYRNNITRKESVPDYAELARQKMKRPLTATNFTNSEMI